MSLQFLDDTVAFARMRLARDEEGPAEDRPHLHLRVLRYREQPPPRRHRHAGRRAARPAARTVSGCNELADRKDRSSNRALDGRSFSLRVEGAQLAFQAGPVRAHRAGRRRTSVWRGAFSFVNPPEDPVLEFYGVIVPEGPLSPRLARLRAGDALQVASNPAGFLVLREVARRAHLVAALDRHRHRAVPVYLAHRERRGSVSVNVVLVHAARHARELDLPRHDSRLQKQRGSALRYVTFVSREAAPGSLAGRIPAAIGDGRLEAAAGTRLVRRDLAGAALRQPGHAEGRHRGAASSAACASTAGAARARSPWRASGEARWLLAAPARRRRLARAAARVRSPTTTPTPSSAGALAVTSTCTATQADELDERIARFLRLASRAGAAAVRARMSEDAATPRSRDGLSPRGPGLGLRCLRSVQAQESHARGRRRSRRRCSIG